MATLKELLKQQQDLQAQIEAARQSEISAAVTKVRALVQEHQLTVQDVFPSGRKGARAKPASKVPPKYRDPATGMTWTGRGKPPKWIEGKDRTKFLIA